MRTTCSDSRYARPSTATVSASCAARRASTSAARWIAFSPIHGRAEWARAPSNVGPEVQRALAAGLDPAVGRLEQDREVAGDEVGPVGEQRAAAR